MAIITAFGPGFSVFSVFQAKDRFDSNNFSMFSSSSNKVYNSHDGLTLILTEEHHC